MYLKRTYMAVGVNIEENKCIVVYNHYTIFQHKLRKVYKERRKTQNCVLQTLYYKCAAMSANIFIKI